MIEVKELIKNFYNDDVEQKVLKSIDLTINDGEFISIIGPSGSGKSTFLYQLSLLDHPTSGEILLNGVDFESLSSYERTLYRLNNFGFVFQDYAVMPELDAIENVALPILMQGLGREKSYKKAKEVLETVGLGDRFNHLPGQLSGGEKQRVAIARSIGCNPKILFADEPTANLDSVNSREIVNIFKELHKNGQNIVMVTHEEEYAYEADRVVFLRDGIIEEIKDGNK
tara:strand:+ start:1498 stop:2178 length:681 start_codon:yes stop_codon:yes gene_type:complete